MVDRSDIPPAFEATIPAAMLRLHPTTFLMLPNEFMLLISQIALLWGGFENDFGSVLAVMLRANGLDDAIARGISFENKADLLRKECKKLFESQPAILNHIQQIIDSAKTIQIKRNLLLHGSLVIQITTKEDMTQPPDVTIFARGRRKKQNIIEKFTQADIENLAADLGHLAARMAQFKRPPVDFLPDLSLQDRSFLLGLLHQHRPPPATPPTHEGRPIPFRE
jgi:hypothetical protein